MPDACKQSRRAFLYWARDVKRVSILVKTGKPSECTRKTIQTIPTTCTTTAELVQISSEVEDTNTTDESDTVQVDHVDITPFQEEEPYWNQETESQSDEIQSNLIGKNVPVNIQNLIEPPVCRRTRDIDLDHVRNLEDQFRKNSDVYTVMIGYVPSPVLAEDLRKPSSHKVEVLGGNHTRQALINLGKTDMCVNMNLYTGLTDLEALRLGILHNELHNFSKKPTFVDQCKLFRSILQNVELDLEGKGKKIISTEWRERLARLTDTDKSKLSKYQTHMHCASLSDEVWSILSKLFSVWKEQKIKGQPRGELKQTHVFNLFRIHENSEKKDILNKLTSGELSYQDFQRLCSKRSSKCMKEKSKSKEKVTNERKEKTNDSDVQEDQQYMIVRLREDLQMQRSLVVQLKEKNNSITMKKKEIEKQLEIEIQKGLETKQQSKEHETSLSNRVKELELLKKEMEILKSSREMPVKKQVSTENEKVKILEERINVLKRQVSKRDEELENLRRELNAAQDTSNRVRLQLKNLQKNEQGNKDKKKDSSKNSSDKDISSNPEDRLEKEDKNSSSNKKRKLECLEPQTQIQSPEVIFEQIALVEYTNKKLYLGVLKGKSLMYTKSPVGTLSEDFVLKKDCFHLNPRDVQDICDAFLICKMTCAVTNFKICISAEDKMKMESETRQYLKKND